MNRSMLFLLVIVLFVLTFVGCQSEANIKREKDNNDQDNEVTKQIDNATRGDIRAIYTVGKRDKELLEKQKEYENKGYTYFQVIKNKQNLDNVIKKYELINEKKDQNLSYTEKFFNDYAIIAIYPGEASKNIYYYIKNVDKENDHWEVEIEKEVFPKSEDDRLNRVILLEMRKDLYKQINNFRIDIRTKLVLSEDFNKNELTYYDLQLGNLSLKWTKEKIQNMIGKKSSETIKDPEPYEEKLIYNDGTEILFKDMKAFEISVTSPKYITPRGLKVGDSEDKLKDLYGEPSFIKNGIYSYDLSQNLYPFHVEVKGGKVIRLKINSAY